MNDSAPQVLGFAAVPNWMIHDETVSGSAILTYAALASYTGRDGLAWPSIEALAVRAKMGVRSTRDALRELEALGVLSTTKRHMKPNLYQLSMHTITRHQAPGDTFAPGTERPLHPARDAAKQEPGNKATTSNEVVAMADKRSTTRRGTRLPDDWQVSDALRQWAHSNLPASFDFGRETENFRDHWAATPGQRGVKLDWDATWRKWMRTAAERSPQARADAPRRLTNAERAVMEVMQGGGLAPLAPLPAIGAGR